jgi:hypothetical protein
MADKFFEDKEEMEDNQEPQKIKVGEAEYTQDELNELVGLGKLGKEVEEKYNTKLDRVYPEFTKNSQKVKDYESELEKLRAEKAERERDPKAQLTPEELREKALQDAEKIGLVHQGNVSAFIRREMQIAKLEQDVQSLVAEAAEKGIKTSDLAIVEHMEKEGFKDPRKAFKDMFEDQLAKYDREQEEKLKQEGLVTNDVSTAGFKLPREIKLDKSNLHKYVEEALQES